MKTDFSIKFKRKTIRNKGMEMEHSKIKGMEVEREILIPINEVPKKGRR